MKLLLLLFLPLFSCNSYIDERWAIYDSSKKENNYGVMYEYTVYIEMQGKKLKKVIYADTREEAIFKAQASLIIHKAVKTDSDFNNIMNVMGEFFK